MSDSRPVSLHASGPPETRLPEDPPALRHALAQAVDRGEDAVAAVVAANPRCSAAWAALGDASSTPIARYAAYRVGYHRGLDTLRANGWRGSGYVRFAHEPNRGFLRCLAGLAAQAEAIGETDEAERCQLFLAQLDPATYPPR